MQNNLRYVYIEISHKIHLPSFTRMGTVDSEIMAKIHGLGSLTMVNTMPVGVRIALVLR